MLLLIREMITPEEMKYTRDVEKLIQKAMVELYENGSPLFGRRPLNQMELIHEVRRHLDLPVQERTVLHAKDFADVFENELPPIFSEPALNIFVRRCGSCHQSNDPYPNPFLAGSEEDVLRQVSKMRRRILGRIERKEMPPTRKLQRDFLNSEDRAALIRYLSQ